MQKKITGFLALLALILALAVAVWVYPVKLLEAGAWVCEGIGCEEFSWPLRRKVVRLKVESAIKRHFVGQEPVWIVLPDSHLDQALSAYVQLIAPVDVRLLSNDFSNRIEVCVPASHRNDFTVEALEASRAKRERGEGP